MMERDRLGLVDGDGRRPRLFFTEKILSSGGWLVVVCLSVLDVQVPRLVLGYPFSGVIANCARLPRIDRL
jgi:hypothetical protein